MTRKKPSFSDRLAEHQVDWRATHVACQESGCLNRKPYPWILPRDHWEEGLWPGIRSDSAHPISDYLHRNSIHRHRDVNNLKSSWVLCANLYYPFGLTPEGRELLAGFLQVHVAREVCSVDAVELEYAEEGQLHPSNLLGEEGGARGTGQTSPDVSFLINGRHGLILTENKLAEHSFYRCSARRTTNKDGRPGNLAPSRCDNITEIIQAPNRQCHQVAWGRKYWDQLLPVVNQTAMAGLKCCPAARAGYQLFRQQALAEGIAASKKYDLVVSAVAFDARNDVLLKCLRTTGLADFARDWSTLFKGKARFTAFTHQRWVAWVASNDVQNTWKDWLTFVEGRYGYHAASQG